MSNGFLLFQHSINPTLHSLLVDPTLAGRLR